MGSFCISIRIQSTVKIASMSWGKTINSKFKDQTFVPFRKLFRCKNFRAQWEAQCVVIIALVHGSEGLNLLNNDGISIYEHVKVSVELLKRKKKINQKKALNSKIFDFWFNFRQCYNESYYYGTGETRNLYNSLRSIDVSSIFCCVT